MPVVELVGAIAPGARTGAPATPGPARRGGGGTRFVDVLDREWREMDSSNAHDQKVRQWGRRHPVAMAGCRTLGDVVEAIRANPDPVLIALLELAGAGDTVAGRTIVQTMLPKLLTMARRDPDHELADYVGWTWMVLRGYPVSRRRRHVAANLAMDTLKRATRDRRRRELVSQPELLVQLTSRASSNEEGPDEMTAAGVINNAYRLGLLDRRTAQVLSVVYDQGVPGKEAAAQLGMTVDSVRWRCSRAVRRLADHSTDLLAAG